MRMAMCSMHGIGLFSLQPEQASLSWLATPQPQMARSDSRMLKKSASVSRPLVGFFGLSRLFG
jgi:hypothetical protein